MSELTSYISEALAHIERMAPLLGVELSPGQLAQLGVLLGELAAYNQHTNLVSCAEPMVVAKEHVLDSLALVPEVRRRLAGPEPSLPYALVDVGSGAGFPAMVLAIAVPELTTCLIESVGKKARFLESLTAALDLTGRIEILNDRAEAVAHLERRRGKFHFATARAVGRLDLVAELTLPFLRPGGVLLLQKSQAQVEEEKSLAAVALPLLGGSLSNLMALNSEALGKEHVVLLVEKTGKTPPLYPRQPAAIKRAPLGQSLRK